MTVEKAVPKTTVTGKASRVYHLTPKAEKLMPIAERFIKELEKPNSVSLSELQEAEHARLITKVTALQEAILCIYKPRIEILGKAEAERIAELRDEYDELSKLKANLDVDLKSGYHVDMKFYRLVLKVLKTLEKALVCEGKGKNQPPKTETKQP